ncbi:MAG: invasion protein CiaB, partial [Helicobacter sp.]|nr:invasion protein CiaB [Helicobacter sp.]
MKHRFFEDMQELCNMVSARDDALNRLFLDIDNDKNPQIQAVIGLLQKLDLPDTQPNRFALLCRLVHLSESAVIQTLKKAGKSNEEIKKSKRILLDWVSDFHTKTHQEIVEECENRQLLTPFYRQILQGMHHIGKAFNALHCAWKFTLIEGINPALLEEFGGDVPRLLHALQDICEVSEEGEKSDRSYSIPLLQNGQLRAIAYADAFRDEIDAIQKAIKQLIKELHNEGDDLFGAKDCYIAYFHAIESALSEESVPKLLGAWREVDRAWMRLKTPIQPAHPLEYYEDHYRKAVAPEWDLRIVHVSPQPHLDIKQQMQETFAKLYAAHETPATAPMKALVQHSLHNT